MGQLIGGRGGGRSRSGQTFRPDEDGLQVIQFNSGDDGSDDGNTPCGLIQPAGDSYLFMHMQHITEEKGGRIEDALGMVTRRGEERASLACRPVAKPRAFFVRS